MRYELTVLAVAALLTVGLGSVAAASVDTPTATVGSTEELPANYTVDVVNPDEVSDAAVDRAVETAWANETVRSYFGDDPTLHFEAWASGLDDGVVHVDVAPGDAPEKTRVVATVDLNERAVTDVDEPVRLNESNAVSIDGSDYDLPGAEQDEPADEENASRLTADQAVSFEFNESTIDRGGDGTFTFELEGEDDTASTVPNGNVIRIDLPSLTPTAQSG